MHHDPNRPTVDKVLPLVRDLYAERAYCTLGGGVGGHLHIVTDDGNVHNLHVQHCLEEAIKDNCETCSTIARLMVQMSPTQRLRIYREH